MIAKPLRNMRDSQGLHGGTEDQGLLSATSIHLSASNQILSTMTQMTRRGWGQLRVWGREVKDQKPQNHLFPPLRAMDVENSWGVLRSGAAAAQDCSLPWCPSAPEMSPAPDSPGIESGSHSASLFQTLGQQLEDKETHSWDQPNQDSSRGIKVNWGCRQPLWEPNLPLELPGRPGSPCVGWVGLQPTLPSPCIPLSQAPGSTVSLPCTRWTPGMLTGYHRPPTPHQLLAWGGTKNTEMGAPSPCKQLM